MPAGGTGILGVLQRTCPVALVSEAFLIAQHTGDKAADGIGHAHGRQFAAGEDEVTDGDLLIHALVDKPLVNALIVAADQNDVLVVVPQAAGMRLIERDAAGRHINSMDGAAHFIADGRPAVIQGVGLHDGAVTAAVGIVVHLILLVGGIIPDLPCFNADQIPLLRPTQNALVHHIPHGIGEQSHNINPHRSASLR